MKKSTHSAIKRHIRTDMIEAGAFDGRYCPSVIQSKKRKESKLECRGYRYTGK